VTLFDSVRAVLFDLDGTLIEPSIDFDEMRQRVLDIAAGYGLETGPLQGMHVLELVSKAVAALSDGDGDGGSEADAFVADTDQAIIDIEVEAAYRVLPYDGVPAMLDALHARGYCVGIVTRNCRPAVDRVLDRFPLRHEILLSRDDVERVKPDPHHLRVALEHLGVPAAKSLMCGDHPMDVDVGKSIGARTVGVLRPGVEPSYFADSAPDVVLTHVTHLLQWLD